MQALAAHAEPTVRLRALLAKGELLHFRGMLVGHHVELLEQVPSTDAALDERARIQAAQFLLALGRFDAARAQLDAVQAGSLWARVQAERAEIAVGEGDFARAAQMASAGAARAPSDFLRGRLLDLEATARHHLGENVAELQNRALAALRRAGAHWYEAIVRHNLAFDYLEQGALDDALAGFEAFANVARRVSSVLYIAMIEHNIARVLLERGALADAEQNARSALARMRDTDYRRGEALTLMGLGLILVEQAQAERARHCLREAQAVAELYGVGRVERQAQLWLAVLDHHAGRLAEAQRRYTALRDAFGSDAERDQVLLSEVAALLALERGEPVAPLSLHPRDAARSKWSGALIAAAQARDWQALDALGADPIMSRSFQARLLHTLALRMTSTAG
jgi:tetratricopeptide (TPR) repeat protein